MPAAGSYGSYVLLIDDDPDICAMWREILEIEGFTVATAYNGRDGFERLSEKGQPCVILLDLMMPVMSGWEFLTMLRNNKSWASTPVVIVTAGETTQVAQADGLIRKPVEIDKLLSIINRHCGAS